MQLFIQWGLTLSICLFGLTSFSKVLYPLSGQPQAISLFGMLALIFALFYLSFSQKGLALFIICLALIINFTRIEEPLFQVLWVGFRQMDSLISLLIVVPIMGWVLTEEPYVEELVAYFGVALNSSKRFFVGMMAISQVISYFLLFGSLPMVYQFIQQILQDRKGEEWDQFKSTALSRGFALSAFWVLSIPSFALAVESMGASLPLAILQGFFISLAGIGLAVLFFHFKEKRYGLDLSKGIKEEIERVLPQEGTERRLNRRVLEFLFLFFSLFGAVLILNDLLDWNLLTIIPVVLLVWIFAYYVLKRKVNVFFRKGKEYLAGGLLSRTPEITILLSAGLLIHSLNISGLGFALVENIFKLTELIPLLNPLMLLPFILVLLGFLGLGPLTVMVLVGGVLQSFALPYPPELIVLSLTLGSALTMMISPMVISIIVLSGANGLSVLKNGLQYNWAYACAVYILVQVYIQVVLKFFV